MDSKRKKRTDSVAAQKELVSDAMLPVLDPPNGVVLCDEVRPYWDIIIKGKARQFWTNQDLTCAVELASNLFHIEKIRNEMLDPDYSDIVETERGPRENPLTKVLNTRVARSKSMMIFLKIHPEATQGKSRDVAKTNIAQDEAAKAVSEDDGLIARPGVH
tara:strand:+ start:57 stop:536 length:480 start_codon:yes stop_codon:yes gene_type:complete